MSDPALEALWKNVVDRWDDDRAHSAFLDYCSKQGQLAEAAARYRGMAGDHQRGPNATKKLNAITMLALAQLDTQRASDRPARKLGPRLALIVFFVVGTSVLFWAIMTAR